MLRECLELVAVEDGVEFAVDVLAVVRERDIGTESGIASLRRAMLFATISRR